MKHNWEYIKLGAGCVPKKQIKRATKHFKTDDLIEYIDISSIDRLAHRISSTNSYIFAEAPSRAQQCVENNDVLVSLVRPNLKNVAIINDDRNNLIASSGFCILRGKTLIPKFVYYIATSSFFTEKLVSKCAGAAYPAVNEEDVRNILIPQPYKDTQEKIVNELDKINEIISDCKKAIRNLDTLAQSLFYDYFGDPITNPKGWEVCKLGDKFETGSGGTPSKTVNEYWGNGDIPWIGSNMCQNKIITETDGKFITSLGLENSSAKVLEPNTVLVALVGATIGKVGLLQIPASTNQNIGFVKPNPTIAVALYMFFLIRNLYSLFTNIGNGKFKMANLSFIRNLPIMLPPLSLQEKFAARIEQIEQQKKDLEETIANMQTLLDSRMDYWFG